MHLQKQVQRQRQQGGILILLTISGDQQKQQYHQQVRSVKIPGKKLLKKAG